MNTQRRIYVYLSVFLIIVWLLAACAPSAAPTEVATTAPQPTQPPAAQPTAVPPTSAPEPTATTAPPPAEQITLSVMTNRVGVQAELLEKIARDFEKENPDIKIDFSAPGKDYESLMKIKMAANDMPDVFSTHGWAKIRYGAFLADLRDESWASQIDPAIKPVVTDEAGKVYVLPMDQEKGGYYYSVDVLKEYGIEVPNTWDEFVAACETIKTKSAGKVVCIHMGGADQWPVGQYYDYFSTPLAISPATNDAAALLDGTYDWKKYTVLSQNLLELQQKGYLNVDVLTAKYTDSAVAFAEGKAAFGFYPAGFICEEALKTNPNLNCGMMPIPSMAAGDEPTLVGGEMTTWGVWKDSKHIDAAKKLVAYYAKPENVTAVANSNKLPTGLAGVPYDAGFLTPYFQKYAGLRVFPYFDRVYLPNGMWDVLWRNGQDVLAKGVTPEQATENMSREYLRLRAASQ